jgi:anti-sigma regulatory factor (Ser/Thr protein kinase)
MTLLSVVGDNPRDLQILVNQAVQYSITHRYKLQPQKSVVIEVNKKERNQQEKNLPLKINKNLQITWIVTNY